MALYPLAIEAGCTHKQTHRDIQSFINTVWGSTSSWHELAGFHSGSPSTELSSCSEATGTVVCIHCIANVCVGGGAENTVCIGHTLQYTQTDLALIYTNRTTTDNMLKVALMGIQLRFSSCSVGHHSTAQQVILGICTVACIHCVTSKAIIITHSTETIVASKLQELQQSNWLK